MSGASSSPRVPPEIVDEILRFLHSDSQSLRICSLVAKSWVPTSRLYLFHAVKVTGSARSFSKRCATFGHAIRRLTFEHLSRRRASYLCAKARLDVLSSLIAVKSLTLKSVRFTELKDLGLLLGLFPRLQHLILWDLSFHVAFESAALPYTFSPLPRLRRLYLVGRSIPALLRWLFMAPSESDRKLPKLQKLGLRGVHTPDIPSIRRFLELDCPPLDRLELGSASLSLGSSSHLSQVSVC